MRTVLTKIIEVVLYPQDYLILFLTHFRTKFLSLGGEKKIKLEVLRNFEPRKDLPQNSGVFWKFNTCTHFCAKKTKNLLQFHEAYLGTLK